MVAASGIYDSEATIIAALNAHGGGIALFEAHEQLSAAMVAEARLVEHHALDDCLAHALKLLAVEVLALPVAEQAEHRAAHVNRAMELRREVWATEAARLVARGGPVLERGRAACEA